jgi:FSR family fosmidomycin resistance protein-like MFS transporter
VSRELSVIKIWNFLTKRSASSTIRSLGGACLAHVLHDGYTDQLYALLPVWHAQFALSYMGLATVRALYYGTIGGLQVPADRFTSRWKPRSALALSTLAAAIGFVVIALPAGFAGLCVGLILAGAGSSVQHPRASKLVTHAYGSESRGAQGIYNFAGDLGKATLPAIVALLLPVLPWRTVVGIMGLLSIFVAFTVLAIVPNETGLASIPQETLSYPGPLGNRIFGPWSQSLRTLDLSPRNIVSKNSLLSRYL